MRAGSISLVGGTLETAWWGPDPQIAPTIVLLHEGLGSVELWRDVPEHLAAATGCGVFAYSRFGYGWSDLIPLPRPMDYMQLEAQVVLPQVLCQAGIRQAVLVGHSDGGSIAAVLAGVLGAARQVPRGKERVELATAAGLLPPRLLGLITIAAHFFVEELAITSIRRIRQDYETGDLRQRLGRYHRDVDVAFRGWNDAWLDPRFRDFDITGFLPAIDVPILGLQGGDDPYGTAEQLRLLQARARAPVDVGLIANVRHAPHLEAKEATLAAITGFVASLPRDTLQ